MNLDEYLETVTLVNCTGQVTHTLTLLIDGTVRVRTGHAEAVVDPSSRTSRPAVIRLGAGEYGHDQVIDVACSLARGG
ncbi:MAG: hypothetical protein ACK5PP_16485 [Acidimicrobiales bacterium]